MCNSNKEGEIKMKITIEIPKEFEQDFINNRFEDAFQRFMADAHCIAGNYEKETALMLINAFKNSKEYNLDEAVHQLEDYGNEEMDYYRNTPYERCIEVCVHKAIDIVKGVEVEIEKENTEGEQEM